MYIEVPLAKPALRHLTIFTGIEKSEISTLVSTLQLYLRNCQNLCYVTGVYCMMSQ